MDSWKAARGRHRRHRRHRSCRRARFVAEGADVVVVSPFEDEIAVPSPRWAARDRDEGRREQRRRPRELAET